MDAGIVPAVRHYDAKYQPTLKRSDIVIGRGLSILAGKGRLFTQLPNADAIRHGALGPWTYRRFENGHPARNSLSGLLLVFDGFVVFWRRDEPDMDRRPGALCPNREAGTCKIVHQQDHGRHSDRLGDHYGFGNLNREVENRQAIIACAHTYIENLTLRIKTMAHEEHITEALERVDSVFKKRPEAAMDTTKSSAVLAEGFKVNVTEFENTAVVDMSEPMGGGGTGPSPGFYSRTGLISCVAIGIKIAAAMERVPLDSVNVDLEMDWDDRGIFGTDGSPPDPVATRMTISVQSPAPEATVQKIIETGLRNDPFLQMALKPQKIEQTINIAQSST